VLAGHPAIAEVAVIADRTNGWGEVPVAIVALGSRLPTDRTSHGWRRSELSTRASDEAGMTCGTRLSVSRPPSLRARRLSEVLLGASNPPRVSPVGLSDGPRATIAEGTSHPSFRPVCRSRPFGRSRGARPAVLHLGAVMFSPPERDDHVLLAVDHPDVTFLFPSWRTSHRSGPAPANALRGSRLGCSK